jgi:hypothetical protein
MLSIHSATKGSAKMTNKRLEQIEKRIEKIKGELTAIGEMRPGSLTKQYKNREERSLLSAQLYA